jgi:hypothetical protein
MTRQKAARGGCHLFFLSAGDTLKSWGFRGRKGRGHYLGRMGGGKFGFGAKNHCMVNPQI